MRLAAATAWVMLPIVAGAGLYLLKMRVEAQEQHLAGLQKQIVDTREAIHVAEAEWSYLNDPARLREEADRLLAMQPVTPRQIVTMDQIPFPDPAPAVSAAPDANGAPSHAVAKADPPSDPIAAAIAALAPSRRKHP
jgi:hypothetical protein